MRGILRTQYVFPAILIFGLFALAGRSAADPDLWWHLKTGQLIAKSGSIPHADPFSFTRAGQPWITHEWLSEVLIYSLWHVAGWAGLIIFFAAAATAAFLPLFLRCGPTPSVAGIATLSAAFATRPLWGVRPQTLSLLLTSLWLLILERSERNPKLLCLTLPLTLLWVNLHAGFAVGLALSGLFLVGRWIEIVISGKTDLRPLRFPALILALDLSLVSVNPNGVKLFWYPIETLRSAAMQNYIAEWASPNFHRAEYAPFLLIVLAAFAVFSRAGSNLRARDLLLLIVGLFAALRSIRMIPLFALIAVPIVSMQLVAWLNQGTSKPSPRMVPKKALRSAFNAAIILAMAAFAALHATRTIRDQPRSDTQNFPVGAVAFLQTHPSAGPMFNHYDWGGYLIWKLYPARVFIDGRADVYGERFLRDFADTYQLKDDWRDLLDRWQIQSVLVPSDSALATGLRQSPGWKVAYQDSEAIILTAPPKVDAPHMTP